MRVLGIDTATWVASVGVVEDGCVMAERSERAASSHGETLAPLLGRLLGDVGWSVGALDAVAISIGPGSFTGLRIGLGTAKGLAFARGLAVVGVPTLDALAEVADAESGELVCPILDARKGEVYAALYAARAAGALEKLSDDLASRPEPLLARITERCRFLGDAVEVHGELIDRTLGRTALVLPFTHYHPRGATIARLGAARLCAGGADSPGPLEPRYVRCAQAERAHQTRNR